MNDRCLEITTHSFEETFALGEALGSLLLPGWVVLLTGALGTGKTSLAKGICRGAGVEEHVTSPGFTLCQEYAGRFPILHYDLYRIDGEDNFWEIGLYDALKREALVLVEWGEKASGLRPLADISIRLDYEGETGRRIRFESRQHCESLVRSLTSQL